MSLSQYVHTINKAIITGLSIDTKPTSPATGLIFIEEDTGKHFRAESAVWVEKSATISINSTAYTWFLN